MIAENKIIWVYIEAEIEIKRVNVNRGIREIFPGPVKIQLIGGVNGLELSDRGLLFGPADRVALSRDSQSGQCGDHQDNHNQLDHGKGIDVQTMKTLFLKKICEFFKGKHMQLSVFP